MAVIAIVNKKGGVGKSTTAINLAAGLALHSRWRQPDKPDKVLLIDLDPLGSSLISINFEKRHAEPANSIYSLLKQTPPPSPQRIMRVGAHHPNLFFVPTNQEAMERLIDEEFNGLTRKEYRLERALRPIMNDFKYIVIDTPPTKGAVVDNALVVATHAIIPVQTSYLGTMGLVLIQEEIKRIEAEFEKVIPFYLAPTMADERSVGSKMALDDIDSVYRGKILQLIHRAQDIEDAHGYHMDIFTYRPGRAGASQIGSISRRPTKEYAELVEQVVNLIGENCGQKTAAR